MCELEVTRNLLGDRVAQYLENKHRGGANGRRGTIYEDWYAAYQLAKQFYECVVGGSAEEVKFEGQCVAFVDDFAVYRVGSTEYFQLKNVLSLGWTSGEHPIADDFQMQVQLAGALGYPAPHTGLVCSSKQVATALKSSVPANIQGHTSVHYFEYDVSESTYGVLLSNEGLRNAIASISRYDSRDAADIGVTLDILLGAWRALGTGVHSIAAVVEKCLESQPSAFRLPVSDADIRGDLPGEFFAILDAIPLLSYDIVRGYFVWSCCTADGQKLSGGSPRYSCKDKEFQHFIGRVLSVRPSTIDELEEQL